MDLEEKINNNSEIIFYNNNDIISKLVNLIIYNNMNIDTYFHLIFKENYEKLFSLNDKISSPKYNFQKNIDNLTNYNNKKSNYFNNDNDESYLLKKLENINKININKSNIIKESLPKIKDKKIFKIINFKKYNIENCNNFNIIKSFTKEKKSNISNSGININKNIFKKINENNDLPNKNSKIIINKFDSLSNEIRVKKNNKMIFMDKSLIKQKRKYTKEKKSNRKSLYRGVSKNGKNWQTIILTKYGKAYIGTYPTQEIAARVYDFISIKNKGIKAKTNFIYNIHQIQNISEANIDFKSNNIDEIIYNIINY